MVLLLTALAAPSEASTVFESTLELVWLGWSSFLTRADGNRCLFEPSCSRFAIHAVRRDGLLGLPLAADRLTREANFLRYPPSPGNPRVRRDPVTDHARPALLLAGCARDRARGAELCTLFTEENVR
jgi:putative component of membrane protein insertase Oxa1/YidC/SpoIIIJ protein YidD